MELFKSQRGGGDDMMKDFNEKLKTKDEKAKDEKADDAAAKPIAK